MLLRSREQTCAIAGENAHFSWVGIVDPADVTDLFVQVRRMCGGLARTFWLWDMTSAQLLPKDTRHRLLDEMLGLPVAATAVVTAEFLLRIPVTMLLEVVWVEKPSRPPYRFFTDREDATVWIRALREHVGPA